MVECSDTTGHPLETTKNPKKGGWRSPAPSPHNLCITSGRDRRASGSLPRESGSLRHPLEDLSDTPLVTASLDRAEALPRCTGVEGVQTWHENDTGTARNWRKIDICNRFDVVDEHKDRSAGMRDFCQQREDGAVG